MRCVVICFNGILVHYDDIIMISLNYYFYIEYTY